MRARATRSSGIDEILWAREYNVMNDRRTHVVYDDARHYLLGKDKFDIITSDPLDPWAKGCCAYTREFFRSSGST
jgi:predicted membrane-bound spermidine synthase